VLDRSTTLEVDVVTPTVTGVAVDPVCGMKVATVDATPHLELAGETVWFCGEGCRAGFAREHALG
jgi:xanthine dehydrogenase accessory factor